MSAPQTIERAAGAVIQMARRPRNMLTGFSFWDLAARKKGLGIGEKYSRKLWWHHGEDQCFWTVTKVKPTPCLRGGKAWGTFTWRGQHDPTERQISSVLKKQWKEVGADLPVRSKPESNTVP